MRWTSYKLSQCHLLTNREVRLWGVCESRPGLEDSVISEKITSLFAVHQPQVAPGQISRRTLASVYPALNVFLWTIKRRRLHHRGEAARYEMSSGDNDIGAFMAAKKESRCFKQQHRTAEIRTSLRLSPARRCQFRLSEWLLNNIKVSLTWWVAEWTPAKNHYLHGASFTRT